ncbi:MAG: hypothetical protein GY853_14530 [PVC group bacterium]|nr:hypothetical protein [PVC group bacterium]
MTYKQLRKLTGYDVNDKRSGLLNVASLCRLMDISIYYYERYLVANDPEFIKALSKNLHDEYGMSFVGGVDDGK